MDKNYDLTRADVINRCEGCGYEGSDDQYFCKLCERNLCAVCIWCEGICIDCGIRDGKDLPDEATR